MADTPAADQPGPSRRESRSFALSTACDSCKRRKIRCNGRQPCDRCVAGGIACTFGSSTGRTNAVAYIKHLEERVAELQARLQAESEPEEQDASEAEAHAEQIRETLVDTQVAIGDGFVYTSSRSKAETYHAAFSGLNILRRVRDLCNEISGLPTVESEAGLTAGGRLAETFDHASLTPPAHGMVASFAILPSRERIHRLVFDYALDEAMACHECIPREEMASFIDVLSEKEPERHSRDERKALSLLYACLALGRRFEPSEDDGDVELADGSVVLQGLSYFTAAKDTMELTDTNDLISIRTIVCLSLYLMSSSMLSHAYSYICVAVAACQRMGLHVSGSSLESVGFSEDQLTQRRVVFAVVCEIDTYLSSTLGMPNVLRDADTDQKIAVPESEAADGGRRWAENNPTSPMVETMLSTQVFRIFSKILESRYPLYQNPTNQYGCIALDHQFITDREAEIEAWTRWLPDVSEWESPMDPRSMRAQLILRYSRAGAQVALYRPFIQHITKSSSAPDFSYRGFEYGSACIRAAQEAIWVIGRMDEGGLWHEAQWYTIYMLSTAGNIMMLFILANPEAPTIEEVRAAFHKAVDLLRKFSRRSVAARRAYESLVELQQNTRAVRHQHQAQVHLTSSAATSSGDTSEDVSMGSGSGR